MTPLGSFSCYACLLLILSLSLCQALAQAPSSVKVGPVLVNLQKSVNSLNYKRNKNKTQGFRTRQDSVIYQLKKLVDNTFSSLSRVETSDSMLYHSIRLSSEAVECCSDDSTVVSALIEDLRTKKASILPGVEVNDLRPVDVQVTTVKSDGTTLKGYYVFWNFWFFKNNTVPNSRFPQLTSPVSTGKLIPGVYDIWAAKDDTVRHPSKASRVKAIISSANPSPVKFDIRIP